MSHGLAPASPKHGYHFDGQEHDVVKIRKERKCEGARYSRNSPCPGQHSDACTELVRKGDIAVITILDLFTADSTACLPCALAHGVVQPVV